MRASISATTPSRLATIVKKTAAHRSLQAHAGCGARPCRRDHRDTRLSTWRIPVATDRQGMTGPARFRRVRPRLASVRLNSFLRIRDSASGASGEAFVCSSTIAELSEAEHAVGKTRYRHIIASALNVPKLIICTQMPLLILRKDARWSIP